MGSWGSRPGQMIPMTGEQIREYQRAAQENSYQYQVQLFYSQGQQLPPGRYTTSFNNLSDYARQYLHNPHYPPPWTPEERARHKMEEYAEKRRKLVARKLAQKEQDLANKEEGVVINNFLLGCDPEFVAMDENGRTIRLELNEEEIGIDHGGRVGEFRPKPCRGAYALTRRLQRLILSPAIERIRANKLRAGARVNEESLGGHVHFGFVAPRRRAVFDEATGNYVYKETGDIQVTQALDKVTKLLEDLDILPNIESSNRRRGSYGKFGDVRDSNGHMEYRTMASWLYDPKVAYLCLTTAKIAAADPKGTLESLNRVTSFSGLKKWLENYKEKDSNANRAVERIREHKLVQVSPDVNFRERWESLGL